MRKRRLVLSASIACSMLLLLVGGGIRFPDAPLKECPGGFCGKAGQRHNEDDYRLFVVWELALLTYWPVGMLALFFLNRKKV